MCTAPPAVAAVREPQLSRNLAQLHSPAIEPARPRPWEPVKQTPVPVPVRMSPPAASAATPTCAEAGLQPAGAIPTGEINFQAARGGQAAVLDVAEPLPSRRQSVAFVRAEMPGARHSGLALADLAQALRPPSEVPLIDTKRLNGAKKPAAFPPLPYQTGGPSLLSSRLDITGAALAELQNAGIQSIQASFRERPPMCLLPAPAEVVTAPAPPAGQWMRSRKPIFTPIAPERIGAAAVTVGPQAPPLAGPSLPPQLLNFHRNSRVKKSDRATSWPLVLLAVAVILGAVGLFQRVTHDRDAKAASPVAAAKSSKAAPAAPRLRVVEEHPAARSVEVAGVRVVAGPNKKPQLEYIVINHSAGEITGLNIRVAVRSVESLADAPLFSASSVVAALGPNQAKEIRTDLDSSVQPSAVPDWQSLRTEVLVARQ